MLPLYRTYSAKCGFEVVDSEITYTFSPNGGICARKEIFKRQRRKFIKEKCSLLKGKPFKLLLKTTNYYTI